MTEKNAKALAEFMNNMLEANKHMTLARYREIRTGYAADFDTRTDQEWFDRHLQHTFADFIREFTSTLDKPLPSAEEKAKTLQRRGSMNGMTPAAQRVALSKQKSFSTAPASIFRDSQPSIVQPPRKRAPMLPPMPRKSAPPISDDMMSSSSVSTPSGETVPDATVLEYVECMYEFGTEEQKEARHLTMWEGDRIAVTKREDNGWWFGYNMNHDEKIEAWFPYDYIATEAQKQAETAKALEEERAQEIADSKEVVADVLKRAEQMLAQEQRTSGASELSKEPSRLVL